MKTIKKQILATAIIVGAFSTGANAQIDISGSTAGRAAVHNAILTVLANETYSFNGNNLNAASKAIFKGQLGIAGPAVTIRTSWSGSAAGIRDVAANNAAVWFPIASFDTNNNNASNINFANNTANTVQSAPEIGFSDVFQSSTEYQTPTLKDETVGIIPFKFFTSVDSPATVDNMTPQAAKRLYASGFISQAYLTGNNSDQGVFIYATGRDPESGTRITTMAEIGYGVFNPVNQFQPTFTATDITGVALWPAGVYAEGNGGYPSGSSVKAALAKNGYGPGFPLISYLGSSDWSGSGDELSYNGVTYSSQNVIEGKYTFWGYLHQVGHELIVGVTAPASDTKTFFSSLGTAIKADTTWLVKTTDMQVARDSDGGLVNPLY